MIKHIKQQPFVSATAISALIHSTWSLGVLFAGHPPAFEFSLPYFLRLAYWLIPALLIAVALDVGQVSTATSIRRRPTGAKYVTFGVFAVATYYLQWSYMLYHMPDLSPSTGISASQVWLIEPLRNLALWIIPALLPLSTTLYTLSSDSEDDHDTPPATIITLPAEPTPSAIVAPKPETYIEESATAPVIVETALEVDDTQPAEPAPKPRRAPRKKVQQTDPTEYWIIGE